MSEHDNIYTAGFFDGEGGVYVCKISGSHPIAHVSIANNNRNILEQLHLLFGGIIFENGEGHFKLTIQKAAEVIFFLESIQLYVRRRKSKIALAISVAQATPVQGSRPTSQQILLRHKLCEIFQTLGDE